MKNTWRVNLVLFFFLLGGVLIIYKTFYWQVLKAEELTAIAEKQHWVSFEIPAKRGEILAVDGFPLVTNEDSFLVFASIPDLKENSQIIADKIAPLLSEKEEIKETKELLKQRLERKDLVWVPLKHKISRQVKENIESLNIEGIGFEKEEKRKYPEASVAAHLLGFVGSDINGRDKGYFGLEGFYDLELRGRSGLLRREKDALGRPILVGESKEEKQEDGWTLLTTIDRGIQLMVEKKLQSGLKRYGASMGSVIVMDPRTGAILAMASFPTYDPAFYWKYNKELYPNPAISFSYEPGSTFKVIVMAAALDAGVVNSQTRCDKCEGPINISGYTINTWNNKYFPNSTMGEIIQHSDNVGMVFVGEKLGKEKLIEYLEKFGFGRITGIDLQEEITPPLRPKEEWKEIDLATASFGQGIAVTPIQIVRAVGAIANEGKLLKPFVVKKIIKEKEIKEIIPQEKKEVIKSSVARVVTEMMVNAVDNGEAKWAKPQGFRIAGKTGTAQIPIAGHYDEEKTIASFVGFAPADDPKFIMLVILKEPTTSPWGSETAAPLWFDIAKELFTYYGIFPE